MTTPMNSTTTDTQADHLSESPHDVEALQVAKTYAEALLNAAAQQHQDAAVLQELEALVDNFVAKNTYVRSFLSSGAIGRQRKAEVLSRVFQGRTTDLFSNFLQVLNQHDRLELLPAILMQAREILDRRAKRVRVQVQTAVPLPEDQQEKLRQELRTSFHIEPILQPTIDPDLLGGLVVRIGDWVFDSSVRSSLTNIRNQILERSSHEIQSRRDRFSS